MTHTLRRSRSKYGRTRRQRKKQQKMQGGGFFDEFVEKFKPSSPEKKCEEAKKNAEEVCSSVSQEMPSLPQSELDSGFQEIPSVMSESVSGSSTITEPLESLPEPAIASESNVMPGSDSVVSSSASSASAPLSPPIAQSNQPGVALESQMPQSMPEPESSMAQTAPASPLTPNNVFGSSDRKYNGLGGTKRKRKNKKQNRRKKMKSRKYKK